MLLLVMRRLLLLEGHNIGLLLMLLRRLLSAVPHRKTKHVRILVVPVKQEYSSTKPMEYMTLGVPSLLSAYLKRERAEAWDL